MIKYSQNNPLWKNTKIGRSNLTIGGFGCTTNCISDGGSYFGEEITPKELASHKELYTGGGLVLWNQIGIIFNKMKFLYRYYSVNEKVIDHYLVTNPDTVVMLNVDHGYHWVFALGKIKDGYKCSDPYPYPAKDRVYSLYDVEGFSVLIKK